MIINGSAPCRPGLTLLRPNAGLASLALPRWSRLSCAPGPVPALFAVPLDRSAPPPHQSQPDRWDSRCFMIGVDSAQIDHVIYPNDGIELTGAPSVRASRCDRPGSGVTSLWRPRSSAAE